MIHFLFMIFEASAASASLAHFGIRYHAGQNLNVLMSLRKIQNLGLTGLAPDSETFCLDIRGGGELTNDHRTSQKRGISAVGDQSSEDTQLNDG